MKNKESKNLTSSKLADCGLRKERVSTTNYPKDTHKEFCKRCYSYNRSCPNTGTKRKDFSCAL